MSFIDMLLLAVAVAMDCFTMAIASGIIIKKFQWRTALSMAFFFGLFQMAMPLLGWFAINSFAHYVEAFDHWIAFGLLAFLGGRMIRDAYLPEEQRKMNPCELKNQLILGVATSIDALAIGISFACMGYHHVTTLTQPLLLIGGVTFVLTLWGITAEAQKMPYKDPNLPINERVTDLLGRMTLAEKIGQLRCTLAWNYYELKGDKPMPSQR